jgi:predicted transport protein
LPQSPEEMWQSMVDNMPEKTGKSMPDWFAVIKRAGLTKHAEMMRLLKDEHGMTYGYANSIALFYRQELDGGPPSDADLIATQYSGPKAALRPIYDQLIKGISAFGADVVIAPKKAYVSVRRKKQFAIIQPSTKTRVDLGINAKSLKATGQLEEAGNFNAMVNYRVRISNPTEISPQLFDWLKLAYEEAG